MYMTPWQSLQSNGSSRNLFDLDLDSELENVLGKRKLVFLRVVNSQNGKEKSYPWPDAGRYAFLTRLVSSLSC